MRLKSNHASYLGASRRGSTSRQGLWTAFVLFGPHPSIPRYRFLQEGCTAASGSSLVSSSLIDGKCSLRQTPHGMGRAPCVKKAHEAREAPMAGGLRGGGS
jgi:hypothetical protein